MSNGNCLKFLTKNLTYCFKNNDSIELLDSQKEKKNKN